MLVPCLSAGDGQVSCSVTAISLQVFEPLTDVAEGALVKAFLVMANFLVFRLTDAPIKCFVLPVRANISW